MPPPTDLLPALTRLYEAFTDAGVVYAATCCRRVSLARARQSRCSTCPKAPVVLEVRSAEDLATAAAELARAVDYAASCDTLTP